MNEVTALCVAVVLLLCNAFFVGAEFALVSARRTQIEPLVAQGSRAARATLRAMEHVSLVMAGAQLGITACSLGLGALGEPAVAHPLEPGLHAVGLPGELLHPIAFAVALALVVYLHVVIGEMVPKNLALAGPDRAALVLGPPMMVVVRLLGPVVTGLNAVANGVLRLLRVEPRDEVSSAFTRDEVAEMVDESHDEGVLGRDAYDRLAGALGFTEQPVTSVLLTRDALVSLPGAATLADVEAAATETGYSRFPVEGPDGGLIGYLHLKDVLTLEDPARRVEPKWVRPFATVRPHDRLHEALTTLRRRGAHLGRVVEDDGTVIGLVTLEDIIEELVGEIRDAAHAPSPSP